MGDSANVWGDDYTGMAGNGVGWVKRLLPLDIKAEATNMSTM